MAGLPMSFKASSAALIVLPENKTSSTKITTLWSMPPSGILVGARALGGLSLKSSRYIVISREPTGIFVFSNSEIFSAIRFAKGTPRDGIPSKTIFFEPLLFSKIS